MFWVILSITVSIWLIAIFYIVKGFEEMGEARVPEIPGPFPPKRKFSRLTPRPTREIEKNPPPNLEEDIEREINGCQEAAEIVEEGGLSAGKPARRENHVVMPAYVPTADMEDFCKQFGRGNYIEFPAEYIDRKNVASIRSGKLDVVQFAKECYLEIGFRSTELVMLKGEGDRCYRINIFDLISDHYAYTEELYVNYFGQLKEKFAEEIAAISSHPDITPANKKVLVGKYEALPQLAVWDDREFFLILVKSKDDALLKKETDFFKEFVIDRRLFKAKIFKVVHKEKKEKLDAAGKMGPEGSIGDPQPLQRFLARPLPVKTREKQIRTGRGAMEEKGGRDDRKKALAGEIFSLTQEEVEEVRHGRPKRKRAQTNRPFIGREINFLEKEKDSLLNEEIAET